MTLINLVADYAGALWYYKQHSPGSMAAIFVRGRAARATKERAGSFEDRFRVKDPGSCAIMARDLD